MIKSVHFLLVFIIGFSTIAISYVNDTNRFRVQLNDRYGFINSTGDVVIPPIYDHARNFYEGLAAVFFNGLWGCINRNGQLVITNKYLTIQDFHEGLNWASEWGTSSGPSPG